MEFRRLLRSWKGIDDGVEVPGKREGDCGSDGWLSRWKTFCFADVLPVRKAVEKEQGQLAPRPRNLEKGLKLRQRWRAGGIDSTFVELFSGRIVAAMNYNSRGRRKKSQVGVEV